MSRWKEIAKFACGAEAFHAFVHAAFWLSGTTFLLFGVTVTSAMNALGALVNAIIALVLGIYAWGARDATPESHLAVQPRARNAAAAELRSQTTEHLLNWKAQNGFCATDVHAARSARPHGT